MSVNRQIWNGTAFVTGVSILARVGTFLANLAIVRLLGRDLMGQLGLIESWLGFAVLICLVGVESGITKYVAQYWQSEPERVGGITATSMALGVIISGFTAGVIYLVLSSNLSRHWSVSRVIYENLFLFILLMLLMCFKQIITSVIYGLQAYQKLIGVNIVLGFLSFPISYFFVERYQLRGVLESRLLLICVEASWLFYATKSTLHNRGVKLHLREWRNDGAKLLSFGAPTFIGQLAANPIQPAVLSLLASQVGGIEQVGLITTAQRLVSLANFIPSSMASIITPILSGEWGSGDSERFRQGALTTLRMSWLLTLPITIFFAAASPFLLLKLYGKEFSLAWPVTFILLIISLFSSLNETADRSFIASGRVWLSTANNFVWLFLFVPAVLLLMHSWGAIGYVGAYLVTFILYVGLQLWWLHRIFRVQISAIVAIVLGTLPLMMLAWGAAATHQIILAVLLLLINIGAEVFWLLTSSEKDLLFRRLSSLRLMKVFVRSAKA